MAIVGFEPLNPAAGFPRSANAPFFPPDTEYYPSPRHTKVFELCLSHSVSAVSSVREETIDMENPSQILLPVLVRHHRRGI
ncbi:hypothetical protein OUZ56_022659 [Daphnia magna]|uniref:Uncharacterized protein n=1 Tax=Daphnia magna TaxID=35525 RepID=A0ABR0AX33_9CRUS|nr:hypothetical protein OUZ56_022659 [Daphnia magna]